MKEWSRAKRLDQKGEIWPGIFSSFLKSRLFGLSIPELMGHNLDISTCAWRSKRWPAFASVPP